jgi:hypothetical protein
MTRETLARYPYPIVRVACRYCKRRGRYRLESLVATYGPDTTFEEFLTRLSAGRVMVNAGQLRGERGQRPA